MTICIAAISEGDKIVAVTDRMLTLVEPVATAFEITENNKAVELNTTVVALFSGDVIHANAILTLAKDKINILPNPPSSTKEIAEIVNGSFTEYWESIITNFLLRKFKITFQQFMHNQGSFAADLVKQINEFVTKFQLSVEIIIAGRHGTEQEAHIFVMDSMGTVISYDSTGYAAIGSGSRHATFSLIESEVSRTFSLAQSLHALLKAKTRAEYDPGVGKLCDILKIDTQIKRYNKEESKVILKSFDNCTKQHKSLDKKEIKALAKII